MTQNAKSAVVARRYDRIARLYDVYNAPMEWFGLAGKRRRLLALAGGRTLEVGVGTGRNFEHYPPEVRLVGIDISRGMLARARRAAEELSRDIRLEVADVESLPFEDDTFDTATATCVFCSVADPVAGLKELRRVVKPDGRVLLLEHVRPRTPGLGRAADAMSVLTRRVFGFNANRRTEENARAAGLDLIEVRRKGVWREIVARPALDRQTAARS